MPEIEEYVPPKKRRDKLSLERPVNFTKTESEPAPTQPSESDKQDAEFTEIVRAFKTYYQIKSTENHRYKKIFFWMVVAILFIITVGFALACVSLARNMAGWQISVPVMGSGAVTIVVALIKLPEIIATHLFPEAEDQMIVELVKVLKDTVK